MANDGRNTWRVFIAQTLVVAVLGAGIIGAVVQSAVEESRFTRGWKERSLSEVIRPAVMCFLQGT